MSDIRVLQVVEASFAGVGRHVLDLAQGLIERGVTVDLCYGTARAEPAFVDRVPTVGFGRVTTTTGGRSIGRHDAEAWRTVRRALGADDYHVVHGHASKGGAVARLAAARRGPATVYTPNALITMDPESTGTTRAVFGNLERALARLTDATIYVSPEEEAHATSLGLRPRTSRVIPNGIPPRSPSSRADGRDEVGLAANADTNDQAEVVVGFVGRLSSQKNVGMLIDAYAHARGRATTPSRLVIVGTGDDESVVRSRVETLGLADHVVLAGYRNGARAMSAFDVFALPSRYEGFPYVLLEALQAGVPCVATTGCSAGLLLGDGEAGRLVAPNPTAFGDALAELIDSSATRADMAAAAQPRAARYGVEEMVEATLALYEDLAATTDGG